MGDRAAARAALAAIGADERDGGGDAPRRRGARAGGGRPRGGGGRAGAARLDGDADRRSTRAGRPSMRCCSTPPRATGSATAPARRRRSSARSSSPSRTGSSCRSPWLRSASCWSAIRRHRTAHATLLATILDVLAGSLAAGPRRRRRCGGAQRGGAAGREIPAEQPQGARDRRRAVRLRQHRQDAPAPHLRQARRPQPRRGGRARAGARAARTGRPAAPDEPGG